jgi:hypothetical protein
MTRSVLRGARQAFRPRWLLTILGLALIATSLIVGNDGHLAEAALLSGGALIVGCALFRGDGS